MKKIILVIANTFLFAFLTAQPNLFILYPNVHPTPPSKYFTCNFNSIIQTKDKGYLLSYMPYTPNIHGPSPVDYMTIKTDSNFVPKWKKPIYYLSLPLPTGGVVLINSSGQGYAATIEKVTASGVQVWQKRFGNGFPDMVSIFDAVTYGNKITAVGHHEFDNSPSLGGSFKQSCIFSLDTMNGNVTYSSDFKSDNYSSDSFQKIVRDALGNFFILGEHSGIVKLDQNMNQVWAKSWAGYYHPNITDIKQLSNGDLFCSGNVLDTSNAYYTGAFFKFNPSGNLVLEKRFPSDTNNYLSPMEKLPNGNFVLSQIYSIQTFSDSTCIVSVDSNANLLWAKKYQQVLRTGPSKLIKNKLYFPIYKDDPGVFSIDTDGFNTCGSLIVQRTLVSAARGQVNNTLTAIPFTLAINSSSLSPQILSQTYYNFCGSIVGFDESNELENRWKIYPNPSVGLIRISSKNASDMQEINVYDLLGKKVDTKIPLDNKEDVEINLGHLNNGIYFLEIKLCQKSIGSKIIIAK